MADIDDNSDDDSGAQVSISAQPAQASPVNPAVAQYLQNKQDMAAAQQKANYNQLLAGLAGAGSTFAHAGTGNTAPVNSAAISALNENAQAPVIQQQAQQAAQAQDPNSPQAQALRQVYAPLMKRAGIDPSAMASMGPTQMAAAQQALETASKQQELADTQSNKLASQKEATAERVQTHEDNTQSAAMGQTIQQLESARGNPAIQQAEKDIYAATKVQSLAKLYGDPNNLNPQMVNTLVSEVGKIASGGQSTEAELNFMTPNTLRGKLASVWQKLSNSPSPANAGDFIKQYQDYANALTTDAQKELSDKYGRVIDSNSDRLGEANTAKLNSNYTNRFKHLADSVGSTPAPASSAPFGGKYPPGSVVSIKGKTYTVGPDGNSLQ